MLWILLGVVLGAPAGVLLAAWWKAPLISGLRDESKKVRAQFDLMHAQLGAAKETLRTREAEVETAAVATREREDELVRIARGASTATAELHILRAAMFNLQKELESKQAEVISLEAHMARGQEDARAVSRLEGELLTTLEQLENLQETSTHHELARSKDQSEIASLTASLEAARARAEAVEGSTAVAEGKRADAEGKLADAEAELTEARAQLAEAAKKKPKKAFGDWSVKSGSGVAAEPEPTPQAALHTPASPEPPAEKGKTEVSAMWAIENDPAIGPGQREAIRMLYERFTRKAKVG